MLSPKPIDHRMSGFEGPAIEIRRILSAASGMWSVAEIIGRVFPAYRAIARRLSESVDVPVPFGPYPNDRLIYRSKTALEYETPAQTDGLGTRFSSLRKSETPVTGLVLLTGDPPENGGLPDVLLLSARLPPDLSRLTPTIFRFIEDLSADAHGN
jgi:hypothetical protein